MIRKMPVLTDQDMDRPKNKKTSQLSFQLSINNSAYRVIPCQLTQNPEFSVHATEFLVKINVETSFKFTPCKHQLTSQSEEHQGS